MNINDFIYIYYKDKEDNILLENYNKMLKDEVKNRDEIIKIFEKKFNNDFIISTKILINSKNLYPASLILASSIDVLAKHYSGETSIDNVGRNYKRFINKYFGEISSQHLAYDFYKYFRCTLVHSNSTKIDFTLDEKIQKEIIKQDGKVVINLRWLLKKITKCLIEYTELLKNTDDAYNNFINVQREIYK